MSNEQIVLVVGASRGIGLALVEELAARPNTLAIGTVRSPSAALDAVPNIKVLTLDLADDESIAKAASMIPELDTLIINAGMGKRDPVSTTSTADLGTYLNINVLGPHRAIRAFLPALHARKTRRIIAISSSSGSIGQQALPGSVGLAGCYGTSKAALNMLMVQFHNELQKEEPRFTVVPIHPGWVATDMGNLPHLLALGSGGMPPATSAKGILKVVDELTPEKSATFYRLAPPLVAAALAQEQVISSDRPDNNEGHAAPICNVDEVSEDDSRRVITPSIVKGALILRHELGHFIIKLGEEYDGGYACIEGLWLALLRDVDLIDDIEASCPSSDHPTLTLDLIPLAHAASLSLQALHKSYTVTWTNLTDGQAFEGLANKTEVQLGKGRWRRGQD
ncbi:hypothetical protein MVEN_00426700 [Mycena venus]|uniref:NAD(P)-binding protein n=1 Tax=Mycena venus TaxID=2733690 RepID=A0A8H6YQT2_9AGAR|nr:hypothetical protein MVEN_00426700 [Mycena venus]